MAEFCSDLRSYYKGFLICGGPYPTMDPEPVLSLKAVNAVCIGEGEGAICELVELLKKGKDISCIRNLWVKLPNGKIKKNRLRSFIDLQGLPPEDKDLFDLNKIFHLKNYQLEHMLGRGCVHRCSYCINGSYVELYRRLSDGKAGIKEYVRAKNMITAITEIKNIVSKYPEVRKIAFIDDNILLYSKFIEKFCQAYKEKINLPFVCCISPEAFDMSKIEFLKDAGCDDIRFGIESGSERIRKDIMKRPITNNSVIKATKMVKKLGIMTSSFNMIGLPTETKEEVLKTLKLNAVILPDTIKVMTFYPFTNTPIYALCDKLNLIDYTKKRKLDDYDSFTCLKFPYEHQLFLKKIQLVFNWYINVFLDNEGSSKYRKLVEMIEAMDEGEWNRFDFLGTDKKISEEFKKKNVVHYSKFVNKSLAVKFPSKHIN